MSKLQDRLPKLPPVYAGSNEEFSNQLGGLNKKSRAIPALVVLSFDLRRGIRGVRLLHTTEGTAGEGIARGIATHLT